MGDAVVGQATNRRRRGRSAGWWWLLGWLALAGGCSESSAGDPAEEDGGAGEVGVDATLADRGPAPDLEPDATTLADGRVDGAIDPGEGEGEGEGGEGEGEGEGEGGEGEGEGGEGEGEGDGEPFDPVLGEALGRLLDEYLLFSGEPGASLAVRRGDQLWTGAVGLGDLRAGTPLTPESLLRVGSNTKPYLAVLLLLLAEEGVLSLDDPLARWLPDYPQWGAITLRQLLAMRSGIPDYLLDQALWLTALAAPGRVFTPDELLAYVADRPLEFPPGTRGVYSDTNFVLAGLVAEAATGQPVQEELRRRIIEPLGLTHTFLDTGDGVDRGLVHGYLDLGLAVLALDLPVSLFAVVPPDYVVDGVLADCTRLLHPSIAWTAGSLVSTPTDATRFFRELLGGRLVNQDSLDQLLTFQPILLLGSEVGYGLGLVEYPIPGGVAYGHGGINYGFEAGVLYLPSEELGIADLHNIYPSHWSAIQAEAVALVRGQVAGPAAPCVPPPGFFDPPAGPTLQLRFRGPVNPQGQANPMGGLARAEVLQDGGVLPHAGLQAVAQRVPGAAGGTRLDLTTLAGVGPDGEFLHVAVLNLDPAVLAPLDRQPTVELGALQAFSLVATVGEVTFDPATQQARQICITGVRDVNQPTRLAGCGAPATDPLLKLFATIPLAVAPEQVEAYLRVLNLTRCLCPVGDGWGACPAEQ